MKILGIETSCDETGVSIIEDGTRIISNIVTSSLSTHAKTGGIIPENAAREQIKYIISVIQGALRGSTPRVDARNIDAIAVTVGPGLIGSLLVGVETAKTLAYVWRKPIIPVNHLIGHIYANWLTTNNKQLITNNKKLDVRSQRLEVTFPALALVVSGGHTDLVLMRDHAAPATLARSAGGRGKLKWLGGTRDDAAGEALDKIGRLLGLPYPGGPAIEKAAKNGDTKVFNFPRPMIETNDFDFSFSGLKTSVLREVKTIKRLNNKTIANISASVQQAIVDVLVSKTLRAAQKYKVKSILLSGGVASNQKLREEFEQYAISHKLPAKIFVPQKFLCTDNAAMIASAAFFNYKEVPWKKITADPELYFK